MKVARVIENASYVALGVLTTGTANPNYWIFVNQQVVARSGAPLAVIVDPRGQDIRTAYYNRSLKSVAESLIWARKGVSASFDRLADILYLTLGAPQEDEGEDKPQGIVLRFSVSDDVPSGVTVIGYVELGWSEQLENLAELVGNHLSIDRAVVVDSIRSAEQRAPAQ